MATIRVGDNNEDLDFEATVFTGTEATRFLVLAYAATLIISIFGLMMFWNNLHQMRNYFKFVAKNDPLPTKVWLLVVMAVNAASMSHQVYYNWFFGVDYFTILPASKTGSALGNEVILYSVVIMLTQFFWLVCLNAMLESGSLWVTLSIGFGILSSFGVAIAVGVISRIRPNVNGSWPTLETGFYFETMFALDVAMDLALLSFILFWLRRMRKESIYVKKGFSRLSYVLCGVTIVSIIVMVVELVVELPRTATSLISNRSLSFSFSPILSPLYSFGMLSVLNARDDWHGDALSSGSNLTRRTQFTFTEQFPRLIEDQNSINMIRSRTATERSQDIGSREGGLRGREGDTI